MTIGDKAQQLEQYLNMARALLQSMDSVILNVPEDTSAKSPVGYNSACSTVYNILGYCVALTLTKVRKAPVNLE